MSKVNRGKDFENQIREAFKLAPNTSVYRLQDSMGGYSGVANICDFIMYNYPHQYFIECKSCYGNTLPFSNVTKNQWNGLLEMSKIYGVHAGIIVWFIDWDSTYYIPISEMQRFKNEGSKSVNIKMLLSNNCQSIIKLKGKKKRVLFDYDATDLIERINNGE